MILSFLRFIRYPLLEEMARIESEKMLLQDRLERSDQEKLWLREQLAKASEEARIAYRMQVNVAWQRNGAPAPFPQEPHLPPNQVHVPDNSPMPIHRSQGSQLVEEQTRKFMKQTRERFNIPDPT